MSQNSFAVILPAAGRSSRFHDKEKKPFASLDGRAVWLRSAELFVTRPDVCQCIIAVAYEDQEVFKRRYGANLAFMNVQLVDGGAERFESIANGLAALTDEVRFVAIHDAVRPCVTDKHIDAVFAKTVETGAAILAIPVTDTVKKVTVSQRVETTLSRQGLWLAQTPQAFRRDWLIDAYAARGRLDQTITDDAQLVEAHGHAVYVVEGSAGNLKITTTSDLALAEAILKSRPRPNGKGPIHPFADEEMWKPLGPK